MLRQEQQHGNCKSSDLEVSQTVSPIRLTQKFMRTETIVTSSLMITKLEE